MSSLIAPKKKLEFFKTLFTDSDKSPVAFSPATTVHRYVRDVLRVANVTLKELHLYELSHLRGNQIIKQTRGRDFVRRKYSANGLNDQWQLDLVAVEKPKGKFILTKIDIFSRQADAELIPNKSAQAVLKGFKAILGRASGKPFKIQTDEGKEFLNSSFQAFLKAKNIVFFIVNSENKAALVERFNRTLQTYVSRMRESEDKMQYRKIIERVVRNYNDRSHSSTGLTPNSINYENHGRLMAAADSREKEEAILTAKRVQPFKFKVGDFVRSLADRGAFHKAYRGNYTAEVFEVRKQLRLFPQYDLNLYELKDLKGEDIEGRYYEKELLLIPNYKPANKAVDTIYRRFKNNWKFVSLKDYPKEHREWLKR